MNNEMFKKAKEAINNSYSPYSNYKVSAAVLLRTEEIITGVNVENASYGLTMCAERNALFKTYSYGYRKDDIKSILIYTNRTDSMPYPCGACRQVMEELMGLDKEVIVVNDKKEPLILKVKDLLPYSFTKESL